MRKLLKKFATPVFGTILLLGGVFAGGLALGAVLFPNASFAESEDAEDADSTEEGDDSRYHHVTIYDQSQKLSVKTDATTVEEALERAGITLEEADKVEPAKTDIITSDNYRINVYRAHPVVFIDGAVKKYLMTASYDPAEIAASAGITIYDGDEIETEPSSNEQFLESGASTIYKLTRNGGRTITVEETLPYTEQIVDDYNLAAGATEVRTVGEDGRKTLQYRVEFVDGVEVSRELISEEITKQPVQQVVARGAQAVVSPEQATCASWARAAGVSESDLAVALQLIYHESGCRYNAKNASGAYGIPQALPGSKMAAYGSDWETNPVTQIKWMAGYVTGRYGGWKQAMSYWSAHGWY